VDSVKFEDGELKWRYDMVTDNFKEWRIFTPILLAFLSLSSLVIGYLIVDKLNSMNDKSDKLFVIVGDVRSSFNDYQIRAGERFAKIEQELSDLKK